MNYEEKFLQLLKISDNLKTGAFNNDVTEYSERGFHLFSQTADLDVVFDPATQDWSVRCEYEDDFHIEGHREVVSEHGNGWSELVSYLFYDSDLTWFLNAKATDINALRECATVTEAVESQEDAFKRIFKPGNKLVAAKDIFYGNLEDLFWEESDIQKFEKLGFIKDGKCIFPRGTRFTAVSDKGPSGWPVATLGKTDEEFDFAFDDEPDNVFIVLSEGVINEDSEINDESNPEVNITCVEDAKAYIESIDFTELEQLVSSAIGLDVKFKVGEVKVSRGGGYYAEVCDERNFADKCGVMSCIFKTVKIDCFNAVVAKDRETGKWYFWCTPHFAYDFKSGGSNGHGIATGVYMDWKWVRLSLDGE